MVGEMGAKEHRRGVPRKWKGKGRSEGPGGREGRLKCEPPLDLVHHFNWMCGLMLRGSRPAQVADLLTVGVASHEMPSVLEGMRAGCCPTSPSAPFIKMILTLNIPRLDLDPSNNAPVEGEGRLKTFIAAGVGKWHNIVTPLSPLILQAWLVRKQTKATLRCMQALVMAQARARDRRIRMVEAAHAGSQQQSFYEHNDCCVQEMDRNSEENVKIVEMDHGESRGSSKSRNSYSIAKTDRKDQSIAAYYFGAHEQYQQFSPAPSTLADISSRVDHENFEEASFTTKKSNPQYSSDVSVSDATQTSFGYPFFPNYMANTESSRAKTRSQSAPKQRPDSFERQSSRRRSSVEGRHAPKGVKIQRSSSNGSSIMTGYHNRSSFRLDKSSMSLKDSECGSTSTVLTNTKYCRSLVGYEVQMY